MKTGKYKYQGEPLKVYSFQAPAKFEAQIKSDINAIRLKYEKMCVPSGKIPYNEVIDTAKQMYKKAVVLNVTMLRLYFDGKYTSTQIQNHLYRAVRKGEFEIVKKYRSNFYKPVIK